MYGLNKTIFLKVEILNEINVLIMTLISIVQNEY